jgi:hypothetical protein
MIKKLSQAKRVRLIAVGALICGSIKGQRKLRGKREKGLTRTTPS